jgi:hypothetical protein
MLSGHEKRRSGLPILTTSPESKIESAEAISQSDHWGVQNAPENEV